MRSADQLPPEERDTPESPFSHDWERVWEPAFVPPKGVVRHSIAYVSGQHLPETATQALMEAAPFEEPQTSLEAFAHLRDELVDAVDDLEPRLRWIFEARVYRGLSVRQVALELNLAKSHVHRLYQQAVAELQEKLGHLLPP